MEPGISQMMKKTIVFYGMHIIKVGFSNFAQKVRYKEDIFHHIIRAFRDEPAVVANRMD